MCKGVQINNGTTTQKNRPFFREVIDMLPDLLLRLLIGVLAYWLGEKIIGLVKNGDLQQVLNLVLIIAVVLYVIFGQFWRF